MMNTLSKRGRRVRISLLVVAAWLLSYSALRICHVLIHEEHRGLGHCTIDTPGFRRGSIDLKLEITDHQVIATHDLQPDAVRYFLMVVYEPYAFLERQAWNRIRPVGSLTDSSMQTVLILRHLGA